MVHNSEGFGTKGLTEMAQKSASIHHLTPSNDQVNAKIDLEINKSVTQISTIVPRHSIWRFDESMVEIKSQL